MLYTPEHFREGERVRIYKMKTSEFLDVREGVVLDTEFWKNTGLGRVPALKINIELVAKIEARGRGINSLLELEDSEIGLHAPDKRVHNHAYQYEHIAGAKRWDEEEEEWRVIGKL